MTKKKFYVGTLAIALVFALMLAGCDNGTTSGTGTSDGKTTLKAGEWANGKIASSSGEQWFTFTATADTQYIHVNFVTITELYIQLYDSEDEPVGDEIQLSLSKTYFSTAVTTGKVYSIKVCPGNSTTGTYQIMFNDSTTTPLITLTANVWANGNIPTSSGEQWFRFTATAERQYIHINFGTLTNLYIQLYDKDGNTVGVRTELWNTGSNGIIRTLTPGQVYHIKITPFSSSYSGTYQIAFNDSAMEPPIALPSNAIQLSANVWADGNIPTARGEQWFKFSATAVSHYIHAGFGTLDNLYIQLYDNRGNTVGLQTNLYNANRYASRTLITGQEYYIKVIPDSTKTGTYQIAFNDSATAPPVSLPSDAIQLSPNVFVDGFILESGSEQWFKFTATAEVQYIHAGFGTLIDLYIQLYNSGGSTVGTSTNLYNANRYASRTLTIGQEYYIKVTPYNYSGTNSSGTYQIGFNTSTMPPPVTFPADAIQLTVNVLSDGDISTAGGKQWFKFTATATTQYIHVGLGTLTNLYIQLYDSEGYPSGNRANLYSATYAQRTGLTAGQEYHIQVTPRYSSGTDSSGTYRIAFNSSSATPPSNVTQLALNVRSDGNISTAGGEQWFKFTATAVSHYIHASFGTLNNMYVQLYDSENVAVGERTRLSGSTTYILRASLTVGQEYYIRITPYYFSGTDSSGTYQIGFNTSSTPLPITLPSNATQLTLNVRSDGNIPTAGGEQWFKFTAVAVSHYIHVGFGTLNDLYIQLYKSDGYTTGEQTNLVGSTTYIIRGSLTAEQEYYIKVTPYYSSGTNSSGTYQIGFNTSSTPPPITLPANAIQLTLNTRSDGNIPAAGGEQWFKFTATATSHYIHVSLGTLKDMYIQLYDNGGNTVGNQTNLYSYTTYAQRTGLTIEQEYHIKVWPHYSSGTNSSGTYQIGFNMSTTALPPTNTIQLTAATWEEGNIPTASGEQWFKFTATAASHYIHAGFGTLISLHIQLYDNGGNTVGEQIYLYSNAYAQRTGLTIGQEYYIKVTPSTNLSGTYRIAFNTSSATPLPTNAIQLTAATWEEGNISTAGDEQWFKFTATATTQYIHASFGTLPSLYIQLYDNGGNRVGVRTNLSSYSTSASRTLTIGEEYYIKVEPGTDSSGTYRIAFNTSSTAP